MESGIFGHNKDMSYRKDEFCISRKWKTLYHVTSDTFKQFAILYQSIVADDGNRTVITCRKVVYDGLSEWRL